MAHSHRGGFQVALVGPAKDSVEPPQRASHGALLVAEQQRAQGGREGECIEGRDDHRHRDAYGKLLKHSPRNALDHRCGHKYRQQNYGGGNDGRGNVAHGIEGGFAWRESSFDAHLSSLHHHNGVVDHQADGQHKSQERDDVYGEAQQRKEHKGSHNRHRHGHKRNERGAQVLQKDENHYDNQQQSEGHSEKNLRDTILNRGRCIDNSGGGYSLGETLRERLHLGLYAVAHLHGITARGLVDCHQRCGIVAKRRGGSVGLTPQLHTGHIAQAERLTTGQNPQRYLLILRGVRKGSRGGYGVCEIYGRAEGLGSEFARSKDLGLRGYGLGYILDRNVVEGHTLGINPHAHRVFAGSENLHLAHTVNFE